MRENQGVLAAAAALCLLFATLIFLSDVMPEAFPTGAAQAAGQDAEAAIRSDYLNVGQPAPTAAPSFVSQLHEPTTQLADANLEALYDEVNPGVVSVQIFAQNPFGGAGIVQAGVGSGFIVDDEGLIVTNDHVVSGASRLTVVFYNGTEREAEVLGTDDDSDLAVIQVDELPSGTHALPVADSADVNEGQWVVAIGNPFGQQGTMTVGIVSAVGRTIPSLATAGATAQAYQIPQAIQTDAAINPGNSGGPLLNLDGEVIGVNAQIQTGGTTMTSAGIGFAIPSSVVQLVTPELAEEGRYEWPYLGVAGTDVGLALAEANDLETQEGAYISAVTPGGPADEAGIQGTTSQAMVAGQQVEAGGDVIVEMDGNEVLDFSDLLRQVAFSQPGDTVTLTVLRDGEEVEVDVALAGRPAFDTQ